MNRFLLACTITVLFAATVPAQNASANAHKDMKAGAISTDGMSIYLPSEMQWKDGPGALSAGAKMAVLEGDPTKEGVFTMRLRLPDGFTIQPHFHSAVEHISVIAGTFNIGMGDKFDKSATREMSAGTFGFWPAGMKHFAWTEGETIVQLHGIGPWTVTYVNEADDPRKVPKKP